MIFYLYGRWNIKKKKVSIRQKEVFDVIVEILSEEGMHGLTTTKIAKKMGITQPALYRYFKNKDEMLLLFFDELKKKISEIVKNAKDGKTLDAKITILLKSHFNFIKETKAIPALMFSGYLFKEGDKKRKKMSEIVMYYRGEIENLFRIEKKFPEDLLPVASDFVIGVLMSFILRWLYDNDFDFSRSLEIILKYLKITLYNKNYNPDIMI